jgi:hypothetical protein
MYQMSKIMMFSVAALFCMGTVYAEDNPPQVPGDMSAEERQAAKQARREQWENMSEEERATARAQRKEHMAKRRAANRERFENMSEEEREAMRARRQNMSEEDRAAMRERWANMSDEERQEMRERRREHTGADGMRRKHEKRPPANGTRQGDGQSG